jgi:hypothetical protein
LPRFNPRQPFLSMPPDDLLLRVFADPALIVGLGVEGWELLLVQARRTNLTARLSYWIECAGVLGDVPDRIGMQFAAVRVVAASRRRAIEWEVNRLHRVLTAAGYPMLLLKGAAYAAGGCRWPAVAARWASTSWCPVTNSKGPKGISSRMAGSRPSSTFTTGVLPKMEP